MKCVVVLPAILRVSPVDFTTGDFMHHWRQTAITGNLFKAVFAISLMEGDS